MFRLFRSHLDYKSEHCDAETNITIWFINTACITMFYVDLSVCVLGLFELIMLERFFFPFLSNESTYSPYGAMNPADCERRNHIERSNGDLYRQLVHTRPGGLLPANMIHHKQDRLGLVSAVDVIESLSGADKLMTIVRTSKAGSRVVHSSNHLLRDVLTPNNFAVETCSCVPWTWSCAVWCSLSLWLMLVMTLHDPQSSQIIARLV